MKEKELSNNAKLIAEKRYLKVDSEGKPVENIPQMFMRISKFIARGETDISDKKDGFKPLKNSDIKL